MYVRFCETLSDKGKFIPATDNLNNYVKSDKKDYYVSLFKYDDAQKKHFEDSGSVSGINDVKTDKILFDFDNSSKPEIAREDAIQLVDRLKKLGFKEESINVWFSGNKGIHVEIKTNKLFSPNEAKSIATKIAGNLSSFDSVIYNASRIIRVPNTAHPKTGLYKTKISLEELSSMQMEAIKSLAKEQFQTEDPVIADVPEQVVAMGKEEIKNRDSKENTILNDFNSSKNPFKLSPWKLALFQGFFPEGQRSNALMVLAATLKHKGLDREETLALLGEVIVKQAARHNQQEFDAGELERNVIGQVFSSNWQGKTYSEDNFPIQLQDYLLELGIARKTDESQDDVTIGIDQGFDSFIDYAKNIDKNTVKLGIPAVDNNLHLQTGRLYAILSPPGGGKTSFAITALNNTSKMGLDSMFFCYDMAKQDVYQKLIQRHFGIQRDQLYNVFKNNNQEQIKKFRYCLEQEYKNVHFVFKTGQSLDELRQAIKDREEQVQREIKLLIVDYSELVKSDYSDPTQASAEVIQGLRAIAIDLNKALIVLLQPNKMSSTIDEPITSYSSSKGSSSISQAVSSMLTMHRPGYSSRTPETDKFLSIDCVKNRNGPLFNIDLSWDGLTGTIGELDDSEREELKQLRALKAMNKKDDGF